MLETPNERVKLLKAGISGKKIEELYISSNNIKIVYSPVLFTRLKFILENTVLLQMQLLFP